MSQTVIGTNLEEQRVNRPGRPALIIVTGLLAACIVLGAAGWLATRAALERLASFASDDPGLVAQVGRSIAFFDLPPGFGQGRVVSDSEYVLLTYSGADGRSHITFFQVPPTLDLGDTPLEERLHRLMAAGDAGPVEVSRHAAQARGRQATLLISDGQGAEGPYRTATLLFEGRGGPALVTISMPLPTWDEGLVNTFLASLR